MQARGGGFSGSDKNAVSAFADSEMTKSVKVDRALLPEISDQHKRKEMTDTNQSRANSNVS